MSDPLTLSEMLHAIAAQSLAMWSAGTAPTATEMLHLSRTLDACALAAGDLEHAAALRAMPPPAALPPNVIRFPSRARA